MPYTLGIITLGCKVNQYESEALAEAAAGAGFTLLDPSLPCDVYIINTCTVTAESDRKSRQFIRRAVSGNPEAKIIVTGCLSQVSPKTVVAVPGVDYICGSRNKMQVIEAALRLVGNPKPEKAIMNVGSTDEHGFECMTIKHFPRTRAYIKIEDGCESHCSYCIIPQARGKICSKPAEDVLSEVSELIDSGCREIVLTGIETASYGLDFQGYRLADLLHDVDSIAAGRARIRLGSLDPSLIRSSFVEKIAGLTSLAPHFHLSVQSGSNRILALMKRKYNADMAFSGITLLRDAITDVQFTTDFITGFPGETDEDFEQTVLFTEKVGFLNCHVFTYSRRAGTLAATMPGQIPPEISRERTSILIARKNEITSRILDSQVGKEYDVLFETDGDGYSVGHTPSFIEVSVKTEAPLHAEVRRVRISGHNNGIATGIIL